MGICDKELSASERIGAVMLLELTGFVLALIKVRKMTMYDIALDLGTE